MIHRSLFFCQFHHKRNCWLLAVFQISGNCWQIITRSHVMIDGCCNMRCEKHMKNVESSIHFIWKAILKMGCAENFALVIQWKENAKFIWWKYKESSTKCLRFAMSVFSISRFKWCAQDYRKENQLWYKEAEEVPPSSKHSILLVA